MVSATGLAIARWTQPDYKRRAVETGQAQLLTITISHYCELARWAVEASGKAFEEHAFPPGMHGLPALSVRVARSEKHLSSSSRMKKGGALKEGGANAASTASDTDASALGSGSPSAVPLLAMPDGSVLLDSWEILTKMGDSAGWSSAGLDDELRRLIDEDLGPSSRGLFYVHALQPTNAKHFDSLITSNGSWLLRTLWPAISGRAKKGLADRVFCIHDEEVVKGYRETLKSAVSKLDERVDACPTPFLAGGAPGIADIAVAVMAQPMLWDPLYCSGKYAAHVDAMLKNDDDFKAEVEYLRSSAAGKHARKVYEACRLSRHDEEKPPR